MFSYQISLSKLRILSFCRLPKSVNPFWSLILVTLQYITGTWYFQGGLKQIRSFKMQHELNIVTPMKRYDK